MSLALTGLLGFQLYWIKNAITVENEKFNQQVYQALNAVSSKMEMLEAYEATTREIAVNSSHFKKNEPPPSEPEINEEIDENHEIEKDPEEDEEDIRQEQKEHFEIIYPDGYQEFYSLHKEFTDEALMNDSIMINFIDSLIFRNFHFDSAFNDPFAFSFKFNNDNFHFEDQIRLNGNFFFPDSFNVQFHRNYQQPEKQKERLDSIRETQVKKRIRKNIRKKEELITKVMKDVLLPKNINRRIDSVQLRRALNDELSNQGINLPYKYSVQKSNDEGLLVRNKENPKDLSDTQFKVRLFPSDIMGPISFLKIEFPEKTSFILGKMWVAMASSLLLVTIVIFCFFFAINALIRQKKLSEMKNDFINNMTHEFKTPISTVSLAVQALQDKDLNRNEQIVDRYLGVIKEENSRLGKQVEKVLQIATLDKKDFKLTLTEINVNEIIEKVVENIALQIEEKKGSITLSLDSNHQILADEVHLSNIMLNLLDNAIKYSSGSPEINIRTEDIAEGVKILIRDNGIGISKEAQSRVFDKFYRVPTGNLHNVKGFGLGLSYVKTMVEAHGGKVSVKSELNKGSEFQVILPKHTKNE